MADGLARHDTSPWSERRRPGHRTLLSVSMSAALALAFSQEVKMKECLLEVDIIP